VKRESSRRSDGRPTIADALSWSARVGGGIADGDKEAGLGVSLDRAGTRSAGVRRRGGRAPSTTADATIVVTTLAVTATLVVAVLATDGSLTGAVTVGALVPAAVVDERERRLPDLLVVVGALVLVAAAIATGTVATGMAAGAATLAGPILLLHLVSPAAMGFGDVKLAVVLGAAIGTWDWRLSLGVLCLASTLGVALGLLRRADTVAFGTHLVAASAVVVLAAPRITATSTIVAVTT
jgi:leader peptidase (prepilin peptidase) / N-methyltransferase